MSKYRKIFDRCDYEIAEELIVQNISRHNTNNKNATHKKRVVT